MIYHIAIKSAWDEQSLTGMYAPLAFEHEGFIRASRWHQLGSVYERHYKGRTDLILLHIDESKLSVPWVDQPSIDGASYPHIYGKITVPAVVQVSAFPAR